MTSISDFSNQVTYEQIRQLSDQEIAKKIQENKERVQQYIKASEKSQNSTPKQIMKFREANANIPSKESIQRFRDNSSSKPIQTTSSKNVNLQNYFNN